jgi:mono/diheme cytochrome c family protein
MMFPAHFWRNFAILWVAIVGLLGTAILLDNHQDIWTSATTPKSNISSSDLSEVALVAKGQELLILGNCIACHTDRGAAPGAGGRAFETPFGKVYSSNITADSQHGIGQWDTQDFWRALHHGK